MNPTPPNEVDELLKRLRDSQVIEAQMIDTPWGSKTILADYITKQQAIYAKQLLEELKSRIMPPNPALQMINPVWAETVLDQAIQVEEDRINEKDKPNGA